MLTARELEALSEALTRAGARAASSLRELLGEPAHATAPEVWWVGAGEGLPEAEYARTSLETVSMVLMQFDGVFEGVACFVVARARAQAVATEILGARAEPLEAVLVEVGNVLVNGFMGDISNVVAGELRYSVPRYATAPGLMALVRERPGVVTRTGLVAPTLGIEASLYVALDAAGLGNLLNAG